jgi:hypothetical protein
MGCENPHRLFFFGVDALPGTSAKSKAALLELRVKESNVNTT